MSDSGDDNGMSNIVDHFRVQRDYAIMRLENMLSSDLVGYTLDDFKDLEVDFHSAQLKVIRPLSAQDRISEFEVTKYFETRLKSTKSRLRKMIESEVKPPLPVVSTNSNSCASTAKLPKITIRTFDGKLENWVSYKELFDSLIHKRDIPNVEKLHYLLSSVQGPAYDLIKSFPLSDDNYKTAYDTLIKYYDKKRQIALVYYEKLLNCDPVKSKTDLDRVIRVFNENLNILDKYGLPDKNFMMFYLLWSKLDTPTREAFELQLDAETDIPQFDELKKFIEKRSKALENSTVKLNTTANKPATSKNKSSLIVPATPINTCPLCAAVGHGLDKCPSFLKLLPTERFSKVKEQGLCILCLSSSHRVKFCKAVTRCSNCQFRHHTLLHFNKDIKKDNNGQSSDKFVSDTQLTTLSVPSCNMQALLSTAVVHMKDAQGNFVPVRILMDTGSACNFISKDAVVRLGLHVTNRHQSVNGIGQTCTDVLGSVPCEIFSSQNYNKLFSFDAFVLSTICSDMPSGQIDSSTWTHLHNLDLADPNFCEPGPVDMLINVNVFASALHPGLVKGKPGQPIAICTVFGWIVMGECVASVDPSRRFRNDSCVATKDCFFVSNLSLDNNIKRFWEIENVDAPKAVILSKDELSCVNKMDASYHREPEGRMVVPLTFVDLQDKPQFSDSREIALKRLLNLEKKFRINPQFRAAYVNFMDDYLKCGHMEEVEPPSSRKGHFYYIPHHGVLRPDSISTPLRTVYDASAKDALGKSLNDTLLPGPKLQKNIFDLLIRFRWHAIVFTGDIKQMYRQFLVDLEDCDYQRILWRPSSEEPVKDFRLLTVTYGVSCAPYQALWCISKLAREFSSAAPLGAAVLDRDTYVDDIVSGADSVDSAVHIRDELLKILSSAQLHLRKWTSNSNAFLENLPDSELYSEQFRNFEDGHDLSLKILGLLWLPKSDQFSFKTSSLGVGRCTKRSILSDIARIFDPLGLLSPVVFLAKYLMQLLWSSGVEWDDDVPENIADEWLKLKSQLSLLNSLSIPRRMIVTFQDIQFHGFCDASERGYCALVFCRVVNHNQDIVVRLCCAKSKVAPLRRLSIPRLELQAAVLLADVMATVAQSLKDLYEIEKVFAWSDSTVALTWIKSCPSRWKTFVANRTASIQEKIAPDAWHHVSTVDNPADYGSRGLLPADLVRCDPWWTGPTWLSHPAETWPKHFPEVDGSAFEEEKVLTLLSAINSDFIDQILSRYSSFRRVVNMLSYCFRFLHNLKNANSKITGAALSSIETNNTTRFLVKHVQERVFATEIRCIVKNSTDSLPKSYRKLCPFLDKEGLLRVGGRLSKGDLSFDVKHPLLLPRDHRLTTLIIEDYHHRFMHPGLQTLQNLLAQEFWVLSARRAINSVISVCMKCFRARPKVASPPIMGNLPSFRINQIKPFSSAAVDYAGPFDTCLARGRGLRTFKSYICVFVCTATKAVHLELASELTTEAYLAALRRFISRRGRCSRLISDQGRNFIGASNMLQDLMAKASSSEQIDFVFNPPGSPHFSGLAEAGVKSVKTHLARVVGSQRLTFEEFYTVLTQIEAMLNSRPLTPASSDPNDLSVLTPGHFLTLEPLTILPESNMLDAKLGPLQRWKLLQKIHQDFWRKWHLEYLHTLQQRQKWFDSQKNIIVGTLVLIVNEQCSPMKWKVGRVVQLHPGSDGICRVVTIRTDSGELKRPLVKLCPLPLQN